MKRPPVLVACLAYLAVGLLAGAADYRRLISFPVERFAELQKYPCPQSVFWIAGLKGPAAFLDTLERPLTGLIAVALILALTLLGYLLDPQFRLLKPADENPGRGATAHVDVQRLMRCAAALLISMWLLGGFTPLASGLFPPARNGAVPLPAIALSGIPGWIGGVPWLPGVIAASLILAAAHWALWGPRGPVIREDRSIAWRAIFAWAILAGIAAVPGVIAVSAGRTWVQEVSMAMPLWDRAAWALLSALTFLVPALGSIYLALVAYAFRPRPLTARALAPKAAAALVLLLGSTAGVIGVRTALGRSLDLGYLSLAPALKLLLSDRFRAAAVFTPRGRTLLSATADGSDQPFSIPLRCDDKNVAKVERFLQQRDYRSALALHAYVHLQDCASLAWNSDRALELSLAMLERAPSPMAADALLQKLGDSPTSDAARSVLDSLADPRRFVWPAKQRDRWLGGAYLRFGDSDRAREFLLRREAGLSIEELHRALGGAAPITHGTVRGRITVMGRKIALMRVGLINIDRWDERERMPVWRKLLGRCRPREWGNVTVSAMTDAEGRFTLKDVPEGRYVLLTTGGGIGVLTGQAVVTNHPQVIQVDLFHPEVTLKPIDLSFEGPPEVPARQGRGAVAGVSEALNYLAG